MSDFLSNDSIRGKFNKLEYPPVFSGLRIDTHLNLLNERLDAGEHVLFLFTGFAENFDSATTACAVTSDDNFIFASKGLIYGENLKRVKMSDIREISVNSKLITHNVVVETLTEKFAVDLNSQSDALKVNDILRKYINAFKTDYAKGDTKHKSEISAADEIKKFKNLLDEGVISEEEFQAKKKQLLGL